MTNTKYVLEYLLTCQYFRKNTHLHSICPDQIPDPLEFVEQAELSYDICSYWYYDRPF